MAETPHHGGPFRSTDLVLSARRYVGIAVFSRALVPSHFFQDKVLGWQCSLCRKLFCRTLDEVERTRTDETPLSIECEFRLHNCELVLINRQERYARRPVRAFIEFSDITRMNGER